MCGCVGGSGCVGVGVWVEVDVWVEVGVWVCGWKWVCGCGCVGMEMAGTLRILDLEETKRFEATNQWR